MQPKAIAGWDTAPDSNVLDLCHSYNKIKLLSFYYVKNRVGLKEGVISDTTQEVTSTLYLTSQP